MRKEIQNLSDSCNRSWDVLAEIVQNSVDAIADHRREHGTSGQGRSRSEEFHQDRCERLWVNVVSLTVQRAQLGDWAASPHEAPPFDELALRTEPLSPREVRYRAIEEAHRSSSLASTDEVVAWRTRADAISDTPAAPLAGPPIEEVIHRRRSARRFSYGNIARELERAIAVACAPIPGDAFGADLVEPFVIVNAVEGLARGTYGPGLTPIQRGDFRRAAGELALGQELGASAAADVYFLSDLDAVLERFGDRDTALRRSPAVASSWRRPRWVSAPRA